MTPPLTDAEIAEIVLRVKPTIRQRWTDLTQGVGTPIRVEGCISRIDFDRLVADLKAARAAVRRLAIVECHRMAYEGRTVHTGYTCKLCRRDWDRDQPERHAPDCVAGAALPASPEEPPR